MKEEKGNRLLTLIVRCWIHEKHQGVGHCRANADGVVRVPYFRRQLAFTSEEGWMGRVGVDFDTRTCWGGDEKVHIVRVWGQVDGEGGL